MASKSYNKPNKKIEHVQLRMSTKEKEALVLVAKNNNTTITNIINRALDRLYIDIQIEGMLTNTR